MGVADRLRYARDRAGLTGPQVKERTGIGESSLSEYERGKREPRLSQLRKLASAYGRSISFFLSDDPLPREQVLWRERPAERSGFLEAQFLRLCEQYHNLEVWCEDVTSGFLPEVRKDAGSFGYADAEELAQSVRGELQLGDRPGQTLLRVLEEVCGVKVFHRTFEPTGAAASTHSESYGHAVLLNAGNRRWRRNYDLAHELFHLLTWHTFRGESDPESCEPSESEEKLATCFARNLLMPADALRTAVNRRMQEGKITYEGVFDAARQFDVSVEALLWQMHFIYGRGRADQQATEDTIRRAKALAPLLEERTDADDEPPRWPPRYHALAVKALRRGEISIGRFAEYLDITRQQAMTYVEREDEACEEIQVVPA